MLHVLPHSGAGGEEYVELLEGMEGFRFERMALSERRNPALAAARLPAVWRRARKNDLVHVHGDAAAILCLPATRTRPALITLHGLHLVARARGASRRFLAAGLRAAVRRARATICVSESELRLAREALGDLPGLELIRNGVRLPPAVDEAERREARARFGLGEGEFAVAFAGSLDERKDPLTLARAVRLKTGLRALLAGNGPLRVQVEAEGGAVRVLGPCGDLRPLFAAADAFCLPSRREGLSLALLEAMAAGLPPVVSDGPGNPEAVAAAGLVFPCGDARALADALELLAGDPERAKEIGAAARQRVASEFSAERMVRETREVYLRALG